uniref:Cytochrome b-c1 complex subunit 10 n=1 Tax=Astyanax mexicanus TaxID=7994 RepID=A0A8B9GZG6_ASTMX
FVSKVIPGSLVSSSVPTLAVWGGVGGVALVHFTDWRLILDYVPYINGKFKRND